MRQNRLRCRSWRYFFVALSIGLATPCIAADEVSEPVAWLQEYLRIDTTNPPGNESAAVQFFASIFDAEGIEYEMTEAQPGRGSIWARLKGGNEPAILLLHHSDVVSADWDFWDVDPFGGEIRDGHVYGRGALDMKSHGIVHLAAFLELHRQGTKLDRDVIFMATADEEAGGRMGMGWILEQRPEAIEGVGLALTEGAQATVMGNRISLGIEYAQKVPLWVRLDAVGPAGHGSSPREDSALNTLIGALSRLRDHQFEPRIVPVVDEYFKRIAPSFPGKFGNALANIETSIEDPAFRSRLREMMPNLVALTQNTCAITRAGGSDKINVIGPTAFAELDCRLLPGQEPVALLAELQTVVDDDRVRVHPLLTWPSSEAALDTVLFEAIGGVMDVYFPGIKAVPTVSVGFTDSHYLRERGIASYGFAPFVIPVSDMSGYHGHNERISIENIDRGSEILLQILLDVVTPSED